MGPDLVDDERGHFPHRLPLPWPSVSPSFVIPSPHRGKQGGGGMGIPMIRVGVAVNRECCIGAGWLWWWCSWADKRAETLLSWS